MNDTDLASLVRDAVRDTHMTVPEPAITRRAKRLKIRRRVAAGGVLSAGLASTAAAAALFAAPSGGSATGEAQLTAWTVTKNPHGVIDVTIRELKDPAGLQAQLRADGVPVAVTFVDASAPGCDLDWTYYRNRLEHPQTKAPQAVTVAPAIISNNTQAGRTLLRIHLARIPHGDGLHIGANFGDRIGLGVSLVKASHACTGLCGEPKKRLSGLDAGSAFLGDAGRDAVRPGRRVVLER